MTMHIDEILVLYAVINTLNQHDVNGVPWPMVDLMLDSGIELLVQAGGFNFGRKQEAIPRHANPLLAKE